ncbi:MAG: PKD domain-containing protein [Bacteroidales bacterium]
MVGHIHRITYKVLLVVCILTSFHCYSIPESKNSGYDYSITYKNNIKYPFNGLITNDSIIRFTWRNEIGYNYYKLQIAIDSIFNNNSNLITINTVDTTHEITFPGFQKYFCRLISYLDSYDSCLSEIITLNIFNPNNLLSLKHWLSADQVVIDTDNRVLSWLDLSSNHCHATNPNTQQQPLYKQSGLQGNPTIKFDGTNDILSSTLPTASLNFDIFIVSTLGQVSGPYYNGNTSSNGYGFLRNDVGFYGLLFGGVNSIKFGPAISTGFQIIETNRSLGQTLFFVNGSQSGAISNLTPITPVGNTYIGGVTNGYHFNGEIAELLLFNQKLPADDNYLINKYLHDKYCPPPIDLGNNIFYTNTFCPVVLTADSTYDSYEWSNGSINHLCTVSYSGWVSLSVTDRFGIVSTDSIYIQFPLPTINDTIICEGDSIELDANVNSNFSYVWTDSNQDTISITSELITTKGGNYSIKIIDIQGCSFTKNINITQDSFSIQASLGNDTTLCSNQTIELMSPPNHTIHYTWSNGDTTSKIVISESGTYSVIAINNHNCIVYDTVNIIVDGVSPVIDFTFNNQCFEDTLILNAVLQTNDSILIWEWVLGDGSTGQGKNIKHRFSEPGEYVVNLEVISQNGCFGTNSKTIEIIELPRISIDIDSVCMSIENIYSAILQSLTTDTIVSWLWKFGDGDSSFFKNPTHKYDSVGIYIVDTYVTTQSGCKAHDSKDLSVVGETMAPGSFQNYLPFNHFLTKDTALTFSWFRSNNAIQYKLQLSNDTLFDSLHLIREISTSDTTLQLQTGNDSTLYWRVIAYNLCNDSLSTDFSQITFFTTDLTPNMRVWYAADEVNLLTGSSVGIWNDLTLNNNDATNLNLTQQPKLMISKLQGRKTLVFDGIDDVLTLPVPFTNLEFDIIVVSTLGGKFGPFYIGNTSNNGYGFYRLDTTAYGALYGGVNNMKFGDIIHKDFQIQEITRQFGVTNYFLNHEINGPSYLSTPNSPQNQAFVGGINQAQTYKGSISELFCFDHSLNSIERNYIFKYLHDKYGPPPVELGLTRKSYYSLCPASIKTNEQYSKYVWSNGDTSSSTTYSGSGWAKVTVTDLFEVVSSDSVYISYPFRRFNDTTICHGDTITLNAWVKKGYTYHWESDSQGLISGDSSIKLSDAGKYWITVQDSLGCSLTDTVIIQVDSFPVNAGLGAPSLSLCQGDYLGLETGAAEASSYLWNTGSVGPVTLIENAGIYAVTVTNGRGCVAQDSVLVSLHGFVPLAEFTAADSVCLGETVLFSDLSHPAPQDTSASIISWYWQFDDSTLAQVQNPSHLFNQPGFHDVNLIVTTDSGCVASASGKVYIYPLPQANFLTSQGCSGSPVPFADYSVYPAGKSSSWNWDFGDPGSGTQNYSSDSSAYHIYYTPGNYIVRLIVTATSACKDTIYRQVQIQESPELDFTFSQACEGDSTQFTHTSLLPPWAIILNTEWNFGDGSPLNRETHPVHRFDTAGVYPVTLSVQTLQCNVSKTLMVTVDATPTAAVGATDLCQGVGEIFSDQSFISSGSIIQWYWDLGILGISNQQDVSLNFPDTGIYLIKHCAVSEKGCFSDTAYYQVEVFPRPTSDFSYEIDYSQAENIVYFTSECSPDVISWTWDFGDGGYSNLANPVHIYDEHGSYFTTLEVLTVHGCTDRHQVLLLLMPAYYDVGVSDIHHKLDNGTYQFSADLVNLGTRNITSLELNLLLNAAPALKEIWTGILHPDSSIRHDFSALIFEQQGLDLSYYCIEATTDAEVLGIKSANNTLCKSIEDQLSIFEPYPNPTSNSLSVPIILPEAGQLSLDIFNKLGQEVLRSREYTAGKGINILHFSLLRLSAGVYTLRIIYKGNVYLKTITRE